LRKIQKIHFSPENLFEKLMVPSESAPEELSNEWYCQELRDCRTLTILNHPETAML
jgi:hypothetical protein